MKNVTEPVIHLYHGYNYLHSFVQPQLTSPIQISAGIIGKMKPNNHVKYDILPQQFGNKRFVWNHFKDLIDKQTEARKAYCKAHGIDFSKMTAKQRHKAYGLLPKPLQKYSEFALNKQLPGLKKKYPWLKLSDSRTLQLTIKALMQTYKMVKKPDHGQPKFQSRKSHFQSFTTDAKALRGKKFMQAHNMIYMKRLGYVKVHWNRPVVGLIKQATFIKSPSGRYYISLSVQCESQALPKTHHICGIDVGLDDLAILSNGMKFNFKYYDKASEGYRHHWEIIRDRRKVHAQKLIRQDKHYQKQHPNTHVRSLLDFKNYQKARQKVAKINRHIRNQRYDYLQKLTTWLVKHFDLIGVEYLKVQQMNKNHHLARATMNACWYTFRQLLAYKCQWYGKILEVVDKDYTSQVCSHCGMNTGKKPLWIRKFTCPYCGAVLDRDVNASINILRLGLDQAMVNNWTSALKPLPSVHLSKPQHSQERFA